MGRDATTTAWTCDACGKEGCTGWIDKPASWVECCFYMETKKKHVFVVCDDCSKDGSPVMGLFRKLFKKAKGKL
jgi:hypothetical protein